MGLMKSFLMEQTAELAAKLGIEERLFYTDDNLKEMAWQYARYMLNNREVVDNDYPKPCQFGLLGQFCPTNPEENCIFYDRRCQTKTYKLTQQTNLNERRLEYEVQCWR